MDSEQELFPIVDEKGNVIGKIKRGNAHDGSRILHPVVHLHVFNSQGELYLQKRPKWKDIQPNKWDISVGGHVDYGETPLQVLRREVREELDITNFENVSMGHYIFEGRHEREFVYINRTIYDGPINPNHNELSEGRFWKKDEICTNIGNNLFTPNFEDEYQHFFKNK